MPLLVGTDLEVALTDLTVGEKPEHGRHEDWDETGDRQGERVRTPVRPHQQQHVTTSSFLSNNAMCFLWYS